MFRRLVSFGSIGLFALLALLISVTGVAAQENTPAVTVSDQAVPEAAEGEQQMVMVDSVTAAENGWIVIHRDDSGAPGEVIGWAQVQQGMNENVSVMLTEAVEAGESFWAMLHVDAGEAGTYEFPGPDAPVTQDGAPVMSQFALTEAAAGGAAEAQPTAAPTTAPTASQPSTLPQTSDGSGNAVGMIALFAAALIVGGALLLVGMRRRI